MSKLKVFVSNRAINKAIDLTEAVPEGYLNAKHLRFALELLIKNDVLEVYLDLIEGLIVHFVLDIFDEVSRARFEHNFLVLIVHHNVDATIRQKCHSILIYSSLQLLAYCIRIPTFHLTVEQSYS